MLTAMHAIDITHANTSDTFTHFKIIIIIIKHYECT